MAGKLRFTASQEVDCRIISCSRSLWISAGEFGFLRIAGLRTSRMAGLSPSAPYLVGLLGLWSGTARGISGSAYRITVFFICLMGMWWTRSLGRVWDVRTRPMLYCLILRRRDYGLDLS